ncbi:MAG: hypothetical protein M1832_002936 [Thelocarpon impressellum]|nr:MAG: hypothetical protein M1832_002936 [Thelocarpon impressellum]
MGYKTLEIDKDEQEEDLVSDLQASHGTRAGNISDGNDVRLSNVLKDTALERYRDLSSRWHKLTGLVARKWDRGSSSSDGSSRKRVAF